MGKVYSPGELVSYRPFHPGEYIMDEVEFRHITVDQFADLVNCERKGFRKIVDGKAPLTAEIANKLELVTGMKAYIWLGLQEDYDRQIAMQGSKIKKTIKQIQTAAASVLL